MPAKPWVTLHRPEADREYVALLSELPLKRYRDLGRFIFYSLQIQGQLKRTPGVLGYSLMAHLLNKRFWTLSVWEGEADLRRFVNEIPHSRVMEALEDKMDQTHFVRWRIHGSEYPPRWQEAFERRGRI